MAPELFQGNNIYGLLLIPVGELWACIISYSYTPCPKKEDFTLGSDGARYSKVKLGRKFLTKQGFVGQSQLAKPGTCYLKHPGFDEQAPRLGQVQPSAGAAAGPWQLLAFPCCPCQYSWRAVELLCRQIKKLHLPRTQSKLEMSKQTKKGKGNLVNWKPCFSRQLY